MDSQTRWLATLGKLRVNRSQGLAPHKFLLLLGGEYRGIVAHSAFDKDTRDQKSLRDFHGLQIALPSNTNLRPERQHLAWHREHKFCA